MIGRFGLARWLSLPCTTISEPTYRVSLAALSAQANALFVDVAMESTISGLHALQVPIKPPIMRC